VQADGRGQVVARHLAGVAQGVARALADQAGGLQGRQVLGAQAFGLAGRVEGIAEAGEAPDAGLVGDQAGDSPAHGFAADHQAFRPQGGDDLPPGLQQHRQAVRRRPLRGMAPPRHVGELEAHHTPAARSQPAGEEIHEGAVHRRAGTVGEGEGERCRARAGRRVDQEFRRDIEVFQGNRRVRSCGEAKAAGR
jgi:hypothetical protein